jgi:drug/metabolite transporter (DMT)-like permease
MKKGIILGILAATLWGISGTLGQFLFEEKEINVEWLITIRLLISGICLLLFAKYRKNDLFKIWTNKKDSVQLIVFSIVGMLGVQYTYFAAIKNSNAATATVLQFIGPILIAIYLAIKYRKLPKRIEIVAIVLAVLGTFLLVTHGKLNSLSISPLALFLGLASAATLAIYSLQAKELLIKYNSTVIVGWAMLIGEIVFSFVKAPWQIEGKWDLESLLSIIFVVFLATLVAFYSYLTATKIIGPQKASLVASVEPLVTVVLSVTWLNIPFQTIDWIGSLCIISTIFLLSRSK